MNLILHVVGIVFLLGFIMAAILALFLWYIACGEPDVNGDPERDGGAISEEHIAYYHSYKCGLCGKRHPFNTGCYAIKEKKR